MKFVVAGNESEGRDRYGTNELCLLFGERGRDNCKREEWRPGEDMDGESPVRDGRGKD
jgi:hypothetical protein